MGKTLFVRTTEWEVWVRKVGFKQWDALVRRRAVSTGSLGDEDELVPGSPFPTRSLAGQAGMVYARKMT